ncbi:MAG TPA: hypothetical protein VIF43_01920 [Patescibacteria group bacterium]|jgi:hypothetical protein
MCSAIEVPSPTKEQVEEALDRSIPVFDLMVKAGWTGQRYGLLYRFMHNAKKGDPLLVVDRAIGDLDFSKHPYPHIRNSKASLTLEHEKSTHEIPLAQRGAHATIYHGSTWASLYRGAHAATGLQAYFDRLFTQVTDANLMDVMGLEFNLGDPPPGFKKEGDFLVPA